MANYNNGLGMNFGSNHSQPTTGDLIGTTNLTPEKDDAVVLTAECVRPTAAGPPVVNQVPQDVQLAATVEGYRSWPFRFAMFVSRVFDRILGFISMVVIVAVVANIPLIQLLSFGYLMEVSGRVGRSGRMRDGFPGLAKASIIGRGVLGTWICLIPLILIGQSWYAAYLIDPASAQARGLRVVQFVMIALTAIQILSAWFCGGKLRHFLWPLVAPFSLGLWIFRKLMASQWFRPLVNLFTRPFSRHLIDDIGRTKPLENWLLPVVVIHHLFRGDLWSNARDRLWNFLTTIPFQRLFKLGAFGFAGTIVWLFIPTMLLIVSTEQESGLNALVGIAGTFLASAVFSILLPLQTQFAVSGKVKDMFRLGLLFGNLRRAPIWHVVSVLITFVLALPLFLAKIEEIPQELMWTLSLVFVSMGWISRVGLGLAYGRAAKRERPRAWWWSLPVVSLIIPLSLAFVVIMFFTRYLSWHGAWSMIENPIFLLPAPFWL